MPEEISTAVFSLKTKKNVNEKPEDDFIDEDSLLGKDDQSEKVVTVSCSDGTSRRKACKNCSCGLAEREAAEKVSEAVKIDGGDGTKLFKSECGNCSRGDAFRCAGCPYRGKPAFKQGEKVELDVENDLDL